MAWLGIAGLALVQLTYFLAIDRLAISVALVVQYLGPLMVLLWLRVVHKRHLSPSLYGRGGALDRRLLRSWSRSTTSTGSTASGLAFALAAAITFAIYLVGSERAGHSYSAFTTLVWGFGFATLFWLVVSPPWTFPFGDFDSLENLALGLGVVVVGTLLPFLLRSPRCATLPAPRVAVVATLEPVLAALIAWAVHDEALAAVQLLGVAVVVAAVVGADAPAVGRGGSRSGRGVERASRRAKEEATANR